MQTIRVCQKRGKTTAAGYNKKNKVLLLDDEPDVVYLVKTGLERDGFEVDGYTDPALALQNFKSGLYQLLLLDIKMPNADGIELFNRMKKEDDKVRVCFFSASELNSSYKNLLQSYPDKFLFVSKPISIHKLAKQIKHFLSS